MVTDLGFKMVIMALMGLLNGVCHADVVPQETPIFFDNDTLLAPNRQGEMVMYNIVDMTWELDIPGGPGKINVTGTADKVIDYINIHFPDYVWPDVHNLNTTSPEKAAQGEPQPNCNVFDDAPYPVAKLVQEIVEKNGNHYLKLGPGPRTCAQVECRNNFGDRHAAIWWCNDGLTGASAPANEIAELSGKIIDQCIEFAVPMSWTRGQIFHETEPWNVIVTGYEKCR